jgi:hypothetical protein
LEKCILQIPEIIRIEEMHFANPRKILGKWIAVLNFRGKWIAVFEFWPGLGCLAGVPVWVPWPGYPPGVA